MANKFGARQVNVASVAGATSSGELAEARPTRHRLTIKNTDESIIVYINHGAAASSAHFPINGGESVTVTGTGQWNVIAASGTPAIDIIDEYD